jgi:hypothetical protein
LLAAAPALSFAAGLPDTGQTACYTDSAPDAVPASDSASVARDAGTFPRQDCRYGRDPAVVSGNLIRTGGGAKSFDYSKIANNGTVVPLSAALGSSAADWACTRDNVTGLTWEVKTAGSTDLRYVLHSYAWLNTDPATNGGNAGGVGIDTCAGTLPLNQCNTQAYIAAVNAANLCGHADWRLPGIREITTLHYGAAPEGVDTGFFPNSSGGQQWTTTSYAFDPSFAWEAAPDGVSASGKAGNAFVRLVRGGPF